ncbi:hypothetical protein PF66_06202 [Pseudomonas asplenii]|uniref:Uncharacterized protein n=1 Tax=Pseudomonas asplenii TaxID=53407 RepID=A0A0M9GBW5_9PSED|nr:hypothetical protein [Pseudomonas fuscovaginae]KPA87292.1 hypothetical protein PF66_06202 [Pseudomonas fuscovaginae]
MSDSSFSGGEALQRYLAGIAESISSGTGLKVGFLEGSTYPDGTSVPMVAAVNEFGGTIDMPERTQTLYFRMNERTGDVSHRFVRAQRSNFAQEVVVPAHQVTIAARPFFRNMIAEKSPKWGDDFGKILKANDYDAEASLALMGERIKGQLQKSIIDLKDPPNRPSTLKQKAGTNPLVDTGHMLDSVDYEVGS